MIVDWNAFEAAWLEAVETAIVTTVAEHPGECLYAGAFWLLYGDYTMLGAPAFGLNAESSAANVRWHPPDWRWALIDAANERVKPLYEPLGNLAVDAATFERLREEHVDMLARVSRRITEHVRADGLAVSPTFLVGIIDFAQGDDAIDYLRRSIEPTIIAETGILEALSG